MLGGGGHDAEGVSCMYVVVAAQATYLVLLLVLLVRVTCVRNMHVVIYV